MLDKHFGKIVIIILALIISLFVVMFYNNNQNHQQYLEQEIQTLKDQVAEKESTHQQNQKLLLEQSQKLARQQAIKQLQIEKKLLDKQAEIDKIQIENQQQFNLQKEQRLDNKLDKIQSVVSDIEKQQSNDKELRQLNEKMSKQALSAAYISQGLQTATMFKMYVAEFYMSEGKFPNSNEQLGLPSPNSYNTDTIRSIGVSKAGKITVDFKKITGQDKGTISLVPNENNNQLYWRCMTKDFKNIQQFIPQCKYNLLQ